MEKILDAIKEVYNRCLAFQINLQQKLEQVGATAEQQKQLAEALNKKDINLKEREAKLTVIEDLLQFRADANLRMEQAQATIDAYHKRVTDFANYESKAKDEIKDMQETLKKREDTLNTREANLESLVLEKVKSVLKRG